MGEPSLSDFGLTEGRYRELKAAFQGANTLAWLVVFVALAGGFIWLLHAKMESIWMMLGLVLLSVGSVWLLMLFLSGLIKILISIAFKRIYPDYVALMRYEVARRDAKRTTE